MLVLLTACTWTDVYGGGEGLSLTLDFADGQQSRWELEGAPLQELESGVDDPWAYAIERGRLSDLEPWEVWAKLPPVEPEELGLPCATGLGPAYVWVRAAGAELTTTKQAVLWDSTVLSIALTPGGEDPLEGTAEGEPVMSTEWEDCSDVAPVGMAIEWSLDEDVRVRSRSSAEVGSGWGAI